MKIKTIMTVMAVAIALGAVNYLASRRPVRLDLTQGGIYTLSESSKRILADLSDVVTIRVYFSRDLPAPLLGIRRDVDDLLSEFKAVAGSMVQIENIDPSASAVDEQRLALMGIMPVQYNMYEGDRIEVARVFLGMAVMHGGRQEILPVVHNTASLEYRLAEAIIKVSTEELPALGWVERRSGEDETSPWSLLRMALSRRYRIADLEAGGFAELDPRELKTVLLLSPGELGGEMIYALDQYVMRGGSLAALVDLYDVSASLDLTPVKSDAAELLARYGARIEEAVVIDDSAAMAAFSGGAVTYHMPYPFWPEARSGGFNRSSPVTVSLESAVFPWTAPIEIEGPESGRAALVTSTRQAAAIDAESARLDPHSLDRIALPRESGQYTLAAMLDGPFDSLFAGTGRQPPRGAAVTAQSPPGARLFVVGSSRWMSDRFLQTFPQNAALFENAIDYLTMSDALVGIRSREDMRRPIALMPDSARAFLRYANLAAGPLALLAVGLATLAFRARRRRAIARRYAHAS